jgi:hypothetical protein
MSNNSRYVFQEKNLTSAGSGLHAGFRVSGIKRRKGFRGQADACIPNVKGEIEM